MKDLKTFHTPIIYVNLSKDTKDEEEETRQKRRRANGLHHKAKPSTSATLFGADLFAPELRQDAEARMNLYKRKRTSQEPSRTPSFGAMPTKPASLPRALPSLSSPGVENPIPRSRLLFRSSNTGSSKPANHSRQLVAPAPVPALTIASPSTQAPAPIRGHRPRWTKASSNQITHNGV